MDRPAQQLTVEGFGSCPLPVSHYEHILLGHGSGGRLTSELIQRLFVPALGNEVLAALEDQATLTLPGVSTGVRLAFSTDSFVVRPIFFPGGDIGRLAVCGTVNDLAVGGAIPLFLSAAFILKEGLPLTEQTARHGSSLALGVLPMLVSEHLPDDSVARFCEALGVSRRREETKRRDPEQLRQLLWALENPRKVRIAGESWWNRFTRRWL